MFGIHWQKLDFILYNRLLRPEAGRGSPSRNRAITNVVRTPRHRQFAPCPSSRNKLQDGSKVEDTSVSGSPRRVAFSRRSSPSNPTPHKPYLTQDSPAMLITVIDSPQTLYHVHWYQILLFCPGVLYLSPLLSPTHHHAHYRTCLLFFTVIYLLCK